MLWNCTTWMKLNQVHHVLDFFREWNRTQYLPLPEEWCIPCRPLELHSWLYPLAYQWCGSKSIEIRGWAYWRRSVHQWCPGEGPSSFRWVQLLNTYLQKNLQKEMEVAMWFLMVGLSPRAGQAFFVRHVDAEDWSSGHSSVNVGWSVQRIEHRHVISRVIP